MSTEADTYNGWTNRATWHTNLVIINDRGSYDRGSYYYWRSQAVRCIEEFGDSATDALADRMCRELGKQHVPDDVQDQQVNWREIASSWIEEEREELARQEA